MLTRPRPVQASTNGFQQRPYAQVAIARRGQICRAWGKRQVKELPPQPLDDYELVVVGSGNGACAFLSKYLQETQHQEKPGRVLVLEEGQDFLSTSSITHQANWTKSYSEESIYKLHAATTGPNAENRPIISGRAVTQGGGGAINYTMIHESSTWLTEQLGAKGKFSPAYWDKLKQELGVLFQRGDPGPERTPVAQTLWKALTQSNQGGVFENVPGCAETGYIPQYNEGKADSNALGRVYTFTTQFNDWGERTNSGVSLVAGGRDWRNNSRVDLKTNARVEALHFDDSSKDTGNGNLPKVPCTGLTVRFLGPYETVQTFTISNPQATTLVLAAGSSTPRLLLPHRDLLQNPAIGTRVNDHILLPAGFYGLKQTDGQPSVSPKDQYLPLFPEQEVTVQVPATGSSSGSNGGSSGSSGQVSVTVGYDFFAGPVSDLSYYLSHLFVSLWMPNWLKTLCLENPWLFAYLTKLTALVIQTTQFCVNVQYFRLTRGKVVPPLNVITGVIKFNIFYQGYYKPQPAGDGSSSTQVVLKCFADNPDGSCKGDAAATPDGQVAVATLPPLMRKLDIVGDRPWRWLQWVLKQWVGLTYNPESDKDIKNYVSKYADSHLLTQQHLSGGCVLGHAAEDGSAGPETVGQVKGSSNVVVADLSAVPLPRVSTQMTAYLLGYHIANQRYGKQQKQQQQQSEHQAVVEEETVADVASAGDGDATVAAVSEQGRR